jgi:5-methylcytosine-specific restriction endonuclease McrA
MRNALAIAVFFLLLILTLWFIQRYNKTQQPQQPPQAPQTGTPAPSIGTRTKDFNCTAQGPLPDKQCTPGAIFEQATVAEICVPGHTKRVRNVPAGLKREVFAEYGVKHHLKGEYEVDHLIPLELGGSNDIANLFPEAADPRPGFHEKDKVENYLHEQVCSGRMDLRTAQSAIANDWLSVYQKMN